MAVVAVSGATGFIGQHLIRSFAKVGWNVSCSVWLSGAAICKR